MCPGGIDAPEFSVSHGACVCVYVGATPVDTELYYGFTRFAIELNEIDELQRHLYPPTDTRFRPDQRYILTIVVALWLSDSALVSVNEVTLCRARLVLRWVTCLRA